MGFFQSLLNFRPVRKNAGGETEFLGLTPRVWGENCIFFAILYIVCAAFFTVLLVISQTIRNSKDTFVRPGSDTFVDDDDP